MSDIQEKIEHILDRLAVRMYDEGQLDKPSLVGRQVAIVNINEAKAKITQLLLEESNQRIKRIYENSMYGEDKTAKDVQERLEAALKEQE